MPDLPHPPERFVRILKDVSVRLLPVGESDPHAQLDRQKFIRSFPKNYV